MLAKLSRGNLIGGDRVGKRLPRSAVLVRSRQPIRASPVCLATEVMLATLDDRKIVFVMGQWLQPLGQLVARSLVMDVGKPSFRGDTIANAQKDHSFGRLCGRCFRSGSEAAKTD